jgi:hypothetical protein
MSIPNAITHISQGGRRQVNVKSTFELHAKSLAKAAIGVINKATLLRAALFEDRPVKCGFVTV